MTYLLIHCPSFMERWLSWCSASLTGSSGPKLVWGSRTNSLKSSCQSSQRAGSSASRRSGSNHSKAIPFKYDCTKVTLARPVQKALARSWKLSSSCTRKTWSFWGSIPLNWLGSHSLVWGVGSEEGQQEEQARLWMALASWISASEGTCSISISLLKSSG